jgi:UDP-GlcNAc:undecaprenyl-phosphate GlcNAc-1-phosphate transferase
VALIVAAAITAVLTPVAARLAIALGVVDRPGALKVHQRPVAYLGGVAVFAGLVGPVAVEQTGLLAPLGLALLLGLADDVLDLPARVRLAGELGIGLAAAATLPGPTSAAGSVALVVAVVALLNAVNLLDGLDGLASSVAALGGLGFAVVLDGAHRAPALALTGALVGFLFWNRPPARIYLGDAGSYLVGTALALLLGLTVVSHDTWAPAAGALLFVGVPIADTTVAVVRRQRAGRPLLQGDRGHVYDQLVDRGWSPGRATLACGTAQAALVALGLVASGLAEGTALALVATVVAGVGVVMLWTFTSPASWTTT